MANIFDQYKPHVKDDILSGITFETLITAIQSNEKTVDEETISRVYKELLAEQMENAKSTLEEHMGFILTKLGEAPF